MFSYNSEESDWVRESWASAFKSYFPHQDIIFKMPRLSLNTQQDITSLNIYKQFRDVVGIIKGEAIPLSGDYYIIKKGYAEKDFWMIENRPHDLVFENKLFRIYKIR